MLEMYMPCSKCRTMRLSKVLYKMEDYIRKVLVYSFFCKTCSTKQCKKFELK